MKHSVLPFNLFYNTPYLEKWRRLGLCRCIGIVILITWLPLVALSFFHRPHNFLTDVAIYLRFLVALPVLLISPSLIKLRFRKIVNHFVESDIVKAPDRDKFLDYIKTTMELRDSRVAKVIIWIFIYSLIFILMNKSVAPLGATWKMTEENGELSLSLAGGWFAFVSQPIYSFVQLYFLYRVLLWWRFLFLVSRLDLQLSATHGDDTGGLIFLGGSIRAFSLPAFAFSTSIAAGAINLILYEGLVLEELKITLGLLVLISLLLFVAPLLLFHPPLLRLKNKAVLSYGRLGGQQLEAFEKRWLYKTKQSLGPSLLDSAEFSSVTDATSIINKVYKMRTVPFSANVLTTFIVAILLPFIPVFALKMPVVEIFKKLFSLVM
jgi:hypothetical protein